ncbi:hypothetical protein ACFVR2_17765 [Gottfriedia sp. NPDC057991]|uniref:hypothetical protein n=1 Tax=Gottfriedia sp. NPDC057991 TaxID=3346298 RepID=UPI0036DD878F
MEKQQEKTSFMLGEYSFSSLDELPTEERVLLSERLITWRAKFERLVIESYLSTTYPQYDIQIISNKNV